MAIDGADLRDRVGENFKQLAPQQLAAMAMLGVAVLVTVWWFYQWSTAPSYETIVSGISAEATSDVTAELDRAGVSYRLGTSGTSVEVVSDQAARAKVALAAAGLPEDASGGEGYELLDRQGFSTSSFQQRIDLQRALEGELARTLVTLESVRSASVHLNIPEERLFAEDLQNATASVVIEPARPLNATNVDSIVNVVAGAVPGLLPDSVTVADTSGRVLTGGDAPNGEGFSLRFDFERDLEESAQSMLAAAFGPGNVIVRVSADLDLDEMETESVTYDPESQIALREQTITEEFTGDGAATGGVLGVEDDAALPADADEDSRYTRNEQASEFGIDRTTTIQRTAPGAVERLSVALMVNADLDPAPDAETLSEVVAAAVGIDPERGDTVSIQTVSFTTVEESGEFVTAAAAGGGLGAMIDLGVKAGAVVLLILIALFLRRGLRNITALGPSPVAATEEVVDLTAAAEETESAEPAPEGPTAGDLLQIIDQQPDDVAALLRSWVNEPVGG